MIDAGWPGTLGEFKYALRLKGFSLTHINYILVTHYHPDHAGLTQDIKNAGAKLIIVAEQQAYVPLLTKHIKPGASFTNITAGNNIIVSLAEGSAFLQSIGFAGSLVHTPAHSPDSITLVLDSGEAFIGDLPPAFDHSEENNPTREDWNKLYNLGVKKVYPGHADPFTL